MAVGMTAEDIRRVLSNPEELGEQTFEVVQALCAMVSDGADRATVQELILRALEKRSYFGTDEVVLNGLVRTAGLFPYLSATELSPRDLLAYEFHRPINRGLYTILPKRPFSWGLSGLHSAGSATPSWAAPA